MEGLSASAFELFACLIWLPFIEEGCNRVIRVIAMGLNANIKTTDRFMNVRVGS